MKRFKNILFACESSVRQEAAMARAVSLAKNNQARLTVIDVVPPLNGGQATGPNGPGATELMTTLIDDRRRMLGALVGPHEGELEIHTDVRVGRRFLEIIRAVLRDEHDLVIKPAENPHWIARLFGSNDMHLLRKCPCPVWLTHPDEATNYESIVAAIDFDPDAPHSEESALNQQIMALASSLALSDFASLHIVHAWDASESRIVRLWADKPDAEEQRYIEGEHARHDRAMKSLMRGFRDHIGAEAYDYLAPKVHLAKGPPSTAIPSAVRSLHADLVVMGTVARTGIPGFIIGNTAESVLDQLQCAALAVKPPAFVSPVQPASE